MALMTSLIGALLALSPSRRMEGRSVVPRANPARDRDPDEAARQVDFQFVAQGLQAENARLRTQLAELRHDFLQALDERDALRDEVERLWRQRDALQVDANMQQRMQQAHMMQSAQAMAQQQALAQYQNPMQQGQLGMQQWAGHCNCVPARHDALFGGIGD